jgi:hypothetical protein
MPQEWCPIASALPALHESEESRLWLHVADCDVCKSQLAIIDQLNESGIGRTQKTYKCPEEKTLMAYVRDTLPVGKEKEVREHLSECSYCLAISDRLLLRAKGEKDQTIESILKEAFDLLPLRDVSIEYAKGPAEKLRGEWTPVVPVEVTWVQRGTLARFLLGTDKDGTYRISYGEEWFGHIMIPDKRKKAAASSKDIRIALEWRFVKKESSHVILMSFRDNLLKNRGE